MPSRDFIDQGAGLRRLTVQASARVIAMVANGDAAIEMPLLWHLCSALESFGYPVAVLDQTTRESADNPGLQGLLDSPYWPEQEAQEAMQWVVLPAAVGLLTLQEQLARQQYHHQHGNPHPLQALAPLFVESGVIVVYADVACLGTLLGGSPVRPLMALSGGTRALVRVYQSLKQLVHAASLHPLVATFASRNPYSLHQAPNKAAQNLQHCALNHLGYCVDTIAVHPSRPGQGRLDDIHKLALTMIEHALPLNLHFAAQRGTLANGPRAAQHSLH